MNCPRVPALCDQWEPRNSWTETSFDLSTRFPRIQPHPFQTSHADVPVGRFLITGSLNMLRLSLSFTGTRDNHSLHNRLSYVLFYIFLVLARLPFWFCWTNAKSVYIQSGRQCELLYLASVVITEACILMIFL